MGSLSALSFHGVPFHPEGLVPPPCIAMHQRPSRVQEDAVGSCSKTQIVVLPLSLVVSLSLSVSLCLSLSLSLFLFLPMHVCLHAYVYVTKCIYFYICKDSANVGQRSYAARRQVISRHESSVDPQRAPQQESPSTNLETRSQGVLGMVIRKGSKSRLDPSVVLRSGNPNLVWNKLFLHSNHIMDLPNMLG